MHAGAPRNKQATKQSSIISSFVAPASRAFFVCKPIHHLHCVATAKATEISSYDFVSRAPFSSTLLNQTMKGPVNLGYSFPILLTQVSTSSIVSCMLIFVSHILYAYAQNIAKKYKSSFYLLKNVFGTALMLYQISFQK